MDVRRKTDIDNILVKFLREIAHWNQTTAAKLLGIDRRRFNDYYNHRRETPDEVLIKIETILQARGIYFAKPNCEQLTDSIEKLPLSARLKRARAQKAQQIKPRGRPKEKNQLICPNWDKLNQKVRSDEKIAQEYGLKHRMHAWRIGRVLDRQFEPLIRVMNEGLLSVYRAAELAKLSDEEILAELRKGKLPQSADEKNKKYQQRQDIYLNLVETENMMQQPLCQILVGLRVQSRRDSCFDWEPLKLKSLIVPSMNEVDFIHLLDVLCNAGAIEKRTAGKNGLEKFYCNPTTRR